MASCEFKGQGGDFYLALDATELSLRISLRDGTMRSGKLAEELKNYEANLRKFFESFGFSEDHAKRCTEAMVDHAGNPFRGRGQEFVNSKYIVSCRWFGGPHVAMIQNSRF